MTPEAAIALVESFWEEVWAACNPSAVDRFVTEDFVITSAGVDIAGRENFKAWVGDFQSKIADLNLETIETFANADGSRVSSRFRITGRNNGMFGLPADGKPIAFTGNAILAVTPTGKLAHNWIERSAWELYNQLTGLGRHSRTSPQHHSNPISGSSGSPSPLPSDHHPTTRTAAEVSTTIPTTSAAAQIDQQESRARFCI